MFLYDDGNMEVFLGEFINEGFDYILYIIYKF